MRTRTLVVSAFLVAAFGASASLQSPQDKGGEDETGPYTVAEGWPQPSSKAGYIWGSLGQRATEPKAEVRNCLIVVDRNGKLVES